MRKSVAIITGASSGMGREFVRHIVSRYSFLDEIWVIARRQERLESLREHFGDKIVPIALDLSSVHSMKVLSAKLDIEKPNVKILVNSAGMGIIGRFDELDNDEISDMVNLNVNALTSVTRAVIPYMSKGSYIINLASSAAFLPQPGFSVYAASKSYVLSLSRALNAELQKKGIYVSAVTPGPVRTEFFGNAERHHKIAFYKKFVMADPKKVVELALKDAKLHADISVYSPTMKLMMILTKLLPHRFLIKIMNIFA